jgi:DNA-binding CsgD family transcriptional regulator
MKSILFLIISALLFMNTVTVATAGQTGGCHCFRNREFKIDNRFIADDYLLTTSFNSLIAATLDVSKKEIIMQMMKGGVAPADLLIALYISRQTGLGADILLAIHANGGTWQEIMHSQTLKDKQGNTPVLEAITQGTETETILTQITTWMLKERYDITEKDLKMLTSYGFNYKETALLFALHKLTDTPINLLIDLTKKQGMSWSEIAHNGGMSPAEVGKAILEKRA